MLLYPLFLPNLLVTLLGIASVAGTSPSKQKHASVSEHSMEISGKAPRHKNMPRFILDDQTIEIPEGSNWVQVLKRQLAESAQLEKANAQNQENEASATTRQDEALVAARRDEALAAARRDEALAVARRARARRARAQRGEDGEA
uniref:Secreted protein n=1 Tax=Globodera pallida TaxID=36090 RepID=A0A183C651_GLOPA